MKEESRTRNSARNMLVSAITDITIIITGIVARRFFVFILGDEYQGLNGLYSNVISMLSVVELGIGSAIIYNLYKPVSENDVESIKSLMAFYKRCYHIIGLIAATIGILIIPALPLFTKEVTADVNTTVIYLFFLADAVSSYYLSYKRSILYASQQNYIVQLCHIFWNVSMKVIQTLSIYFTKNYYLYLALMVACRMAENITITSYVNIKYPQYSDKGAKPLSKTALNDIIEKIKGLFFHKIGDFVINGTDNLVISRYLGIVMAGLYSNYYLIIGSVLRLVKQIIEAITPSIGNLLVTENREKQFAVFRRIRFINFWMTSFCAICLLVLMEPWIIIWIGRERLLPTVVMFILAFNFFLANMRNTYISFKTAAGIFHEDRIVPVIQAVMNITCSIILVKAIGLSGVFIGTTISEMVLWCYSFPKYVYKKLFDKDYLDYAKETIGYTALFVAIILVTYFSAGLFTSENMFVVLALRLMVCLIVPNVIIIVLFHSNDNFRYCINLVKTVANRIIRKS